MDIQIRYIADTIIINTEVTIFINNNWTSSVFYIFFSFHSLTVNYTINSSKTFQLQNQLSNHLNNIWPATNEWWNSQNVLDARNYLKNTTANLNKNWTNEWKSMVAAGVQNFPDDGSTGFRIPLKKEGLLTRDSRVVERKKYGRKKARRSFQFSKR